MLLANMAIHFSKSLATFSFWTHGTLKRNLVFTNGVPGMSTAVLQFVFERFL